MVQRSSGKNGGYSGGSFGKKNAHFFYEDEKLAVFIDGSNLYAAARSLNFDIDYRKLLAWAGQRGRLIRAFYYTALIEDQDYTPIRPLVDWLDYNGYTMVTKPAKEFTDNQGRRKVKGNIDIELAVDMMEMADKVDHIILFSGDGDFRKLVEAVQRKGVRVSVVSTISTTPPMIADELRRQADQFMDLTSVLEYIQRDGGSPRPPVNQGEVFNSIDEDEEIPAYLKA
ncbi:MAG: NYN domain-containing protein [Micavibrio aeruginosavorus]|uniref:NYN domain-containing protein n=1 Tax=Micavibrio aeruginosavorus TaxID=349221 RepID=A0A2W5FM67_9BACT|nr:MAG: NYN domain-containing protein [Micavibrio aeruginosavorus]